MSVQVGSTLAKGGLVLTVPSLAADPGSAAECQNFEVDIGGGFRRIDGYERFDGRTPPSSGWVEEWEWDLAEGGTNPNGTTWAAVPAVTGNLNEAVVLTIPLYGLSLVGVITMAVGGEFALLAHDGNQATYTERVYNTQAEFLAAIEAFPDVATAVVSGGNLVITSTVPMIPGVYPRLELLQWVVLDDSNTEDSLRDAISGPPGYGPIYGVATFKGIVICARDIDEDSNESRLYRSTPTGWEQIPMPSETVRIGGALYNFAVYNFYGDPAKEGLYGADGKNKAFEISGNPYPDTMTYTEIDTVAVRGAVTYYPQRVTPHAMHLFLSFAGGWVQYSGIGNPFSDDVNDGAGGIAYPAPITDMRSMRDDAMVIATRDNLYPLYGTSEADWTSKGVAAQGDGIGAISETLSNAAGTFFADTSGIFVMEATNTYGNFATAALSAPIQPLYQFLAPTILGAAPVKTRGLYRLYCQGGQVISMTFAGNKVMGFGYSVLPVQPQCLGYGTVGPTPDDQIDAVFIGGADGMVYRMDSGDSFDGESIECALRFHFHNAKNPRINKRWRKAVFEINTPSIFSMQANAIFNYGGTEESALHSMSLAGLTQSGGVWNVDDWNEFYWMGKYVGEGEFNIDGHARSVSLMLYAIGKIPSFLIEGYSVHYSPRRLVR